MSEFPFRFYGSNPYDWIEGANMGHGYQVTFTRAPSERDLLAIAELWDGCMADGPVAPGNWRWAQDRADLVVGERSEDGDPESFREHMTDFFTRLHALVPLLDVVWLNANDTGDDPWDEWSLEQGPPAAWPDDAAEAGFEDFQRPADTTLPPLASHPTFDGAVRRAGARRARAKVDKVAAKLNRRGKLTLKAVEEEIEPPAPASFEGTPFVIPDPPAVKQDGGWVWMKGDHPIDSVRARPMVWAYDGDDRKGFETIAWLDDAGQRREAHAPGAGNVTLSPAGQEALIVPRRRAFHLDLKSGAVRCWYERQREDGFELTGAAFCDGGVWALLGNDRLRSFAAGESPRPIAELKVDKGEALDAVCDGRALVVRQEPFDRVPKVAIVSALGGALELIEEIKAALTFAFERDDKIYLRHDPSGSLFELSGLAAALDGAKAKAAPAGPLVQLADVTPAQAKLIDAKRAKDVPKPIRAKLPGYQWIAFLKPSPLVVGANFSDMSVAWVTSNGEVVELDRHLKLACVEAQADGLQIALTDGTSIYVAHGATGQSRELPVPFDEDVDTVTSNRGELSVLGFDWAVEGRLAVQTFGRMLLVDGEGLELAALPSEATQAEIRAVCGGKVIVARLDGRVVVYATDGRALKELHSIPVSAELFADDRTGRCYLCPSGGAWQELVGLDAAWRQAFA